MSTRADLSLIAFTPGAPAPVADLRLPLPPPTGLTVATGARGLERVQADLPLTTPQAFDLYRRLGGVTATVTAAGGPVARGRCEDLSLRDGGATVAALGPWRELSDAPYTALWSASGTAGWFAASPAYGSALSNRAPEMYAIEVSERIVISTTKGASYANNADLATVAIRGPDGGERGFTGFQCRVRGVLPTNWAIEFVTFDGAFSSQTAVGSLTLSGAVDRAVHFAFTAAGAVGVNFFNTSGGASAPAGETGDFYLWLSDLRVVTSTAQRVNTTLTANRAAGAGVTATVASTSGMYAGMQLVLNSGGATSEVVTVQSVTSATQFVATFVGSYSSGQAVQGHKVRADEVPAALLSFITALNTGGTLSSSAALVATCDRDLLNALWEDTTPADIIAELAERGDGTQRFETGAGADGRLYFRPVGSAAQAWAIDAAQLTVDQSLSALVNSVYPRYQAADGRTLRGATVTDGISRARYGLTRRGAVDADTTSATIAARVATTAADDTSDPVPRAGITVRAIYTLSGAPAPLWLVRSGDEVTIRNLPPAAAGTINRLQTFRLAETEWDAVAGTLRLVPESPLPDYEHQAAAIQQAAEVAAVASGTPAATPITVLPPQQTRRRNPPRRP